MNIKKYALFFSGILLVACQSQSQTKCRCVEDYKFNDGAFATNVTAVKKNDGTYLTFNCASFMRMYVNDENGFEIEKEQLDCVSRKRTTLKLNHDFEYYVPQKDEAIINQKEAHEIFLNKIKSKTKLFFEFSMNEKKEIIRIGDFLMPEQ